MARYTHTPVNVYMDMPFSHLFKYAKKINELLEEETKMINKQIKERRK